MIGSIHFLFKNSCSRKCKWVRKFSSRDWKQSTGSLLPQRHEDNFNHMESRHEAPAAATIYVEKKKSCYFLVARCIERFFEAWFFFLPRHPPWINSIFPLFFFFFSFLTLDQITIERKAKAEAPEFDRAAAFIREHSVPGCCEPTNWRPPLGQRRAAVLQEFRDGPPYCLFVRRWAVVLETRSSIEQARWIRSRPVSFVNATLPWKPSPPSTPRSFVPARQPQTKLLIHFRTVLHVG
jgi:hypothetical protein